jgi:hypothetical protein
MAELNKSKIDTTGREEEEQKHTKKNSLAVHSRRALNSIIPFVYSPRRAFYTLSGENHFDPIWIFFFFHSLFSLQLLN